MIRLNDSVVYEAFNDLQSNGNLNDRIRFICPAGEIWHIEMAYASIANGTGSNVSLDSFLTPAGDTRRIVERLTLATGTTGFLYFPSPVWLGPGDEIEFDTTAAIGGIWALAGGASGTKYFP